jgi:hypothetical protein
LSLGFAVLEHRRGKGERNDPERAGKLYGCPYDKSLRTIFGRGTNDGACVMNRERGPEAELRLREMKRAANRGKNQQRHGIQNKNRAQRHTHFFVVGVKNGADRRDGTAAADGRARGNQKRGIAADSQQFSQCEACQKGKRDSQCGVDEAAAASFQHFVQVHAEAERDDTYLKKNSRGGPCGCGVRMREAQAKQDADGEGNGRREKSCK